GVGPAFAVPPDDEPEEHGRGEAEGGGEEGDVGFGEGGREVVPGSHAGLRSEGCGARPYPGGSGRRLERMPGGRYAWAMKRSAEVWIMVGCLAVSGGAALAQAPAQQLRPPQPRGEMRAPIFLTAASVMVLAIATVYAGGF